MNDYPDDSPTSKLQQTSTQRNNPLHGLTLKTIVTELYEYYGWQGLADKAPMNCFINIVHRLPDIARFSWLVRVHD